jgi:hypothetical protein
MRKLLLVLALSLAASPALAQLKKPPNALGLPDPLHLTSGAAPAATVAGSTTYTSVGATLQKVAKEVVDKAIVDLGNASTDANAQAIQIGRDLERQLTGDAQGTIKVACAALIGDAVAQLGQLGSLLGVKLLTGGIGG